MCSVMPRLWVALLVISFLALCQPVVAAEQGWLGLEVTDLPASSRAPGGPLTGGVVVIRAMEKSPAEKAGIQAHDIIISINGKIVSDVPSFLGVVNALPAGSTASLIVVRGQSIAAPIVQLGQEPRAAVSGVVQPLLRTETGGHSARVQDIAFLKGTGQLISGGDDKVTRIWDWRSGKLLKVFRGEIGGGDEGKIYALALAPNQSAIAAAGFFFGPPQSPTARAPTSHIRVLNVATGEVERVFQGHRDAVNDLAYSRKGEWLASGGADGTVIVWNSKSGRMRWQFSGHRGPIYKVIFGKSDSRLFSLSSDGTVLVWNLARGSGIKSRALMGRDVTAVAVAGDSSLFAVAERNGGISVIDADADKVIRTFAGDGRVVGQLAFSLDGRHLVSTCGERCAGKFVVRVLDARTGAQVSQFDGHNSVVQSLAISPDGLHVASGGGYERGIHIWGLLTGKPLIGVDQKPVVLKGSGQPVFAVGFSRDGASLAWGFTDSGSHNALTEPFEYALALPAEGVPLGAPHALGEKERDRVERPRVNVDDLSVTAVKGGFVERKYGEMLIQRKETVIARVKRGATDGYEHTSYTLTQGGDRIISGGRNGHVLSYDTRGDILHEFEGHEDVVWSVAASSDNRLVATGGSDQTVRLWSLATGKLVATLLQTSDGEWVMWVPQGFYTGSTRGGSMVGWHINRGIDRASEYVTGEQYRNVLNRKDIVERAIVLASADAAVREAFPGGFSLGALISARPPRIRMATPSDGTTVNGGLTIVTAFVSSTSLQVDGFYAFVNGHRVSVRQVPVPIGHARAPEGWLAYAFEVDLFSGTNNVELVAYNAAGVSEKGSAVVQVKNPNYGFLDKKGTLRAVAIGVDRYEGLGSVCGELGNEPCDLSFAGKDAARFAETLVREVGRVHEKSITRTLVNGGTPDNEPTRKNILAALRSLAASEPSDTIVVFVAGHGERGLNGRYYFLPTDVERTGHQQVGTGSNIIDWSEIQAQLTSALGRRLLFVDACQAGAVNSRRAYNDRLLEDARADEFAAFAASGPNQFAEEHAEVSQGLFTYALVDGLSGKAVASRELRAYALGTYLSDRVRELSDGRQEPQFYSGLGNFVIHYR